MQSTLEQYTSYLNKYRQFCVNSYEFFFPSNVDYGHVLVASLLDSLAKKSERPQSLLKMAWSSNGHFYDAVDNKLDVKTCQMS